LISLTKQKRFLYPKKNTGKSYSTTSIPLVYTTIDQTLVNSLHGLLNWEIGGLYCHLITTEYSSRAHCIHVYHLLC